MTNDVQTTVSDCSTCARNSTMEKYKRELEMFPASGPPESVAIEILGPFPRTVNGNQYEIVMTDGSAKLT